MLHSLDKTRLDLLALQDSINMIAAMLPASVRVEFDVLQLQRPDELLPRDSLVIRVVDHRSAQAPESTP